MKLALRVFTMIVVLAGITAASMAPASAMPSNSASLAGPGPLSLPAPTCGPGIPTCPPGPPQGGLR